jgi:Chaperone of endosialidase
MSAGINSTVANYGGKIGDPNTTIKQFIIGSSSSNYASWNYLNGNQLKKTIVPTGSKINVLIKGDLTVEGTIFNPSDVNLKENINVLSESKADNILSLKPITYNYKSDTNKHIHFGFIAQDVEQLYPELVSNDNNYKSVNYIELIPIMIEKMKQMQENIDNLNKKIEALENKSI